VTVTSTIAVADGGANLGDIGTSGLIVAST
jgi:hypothetical protein